jgi:hypothetical protein
MNKNKRKINKNWLIYLILGGILVELFKLLFGKKSLKQAVADIFAFAHEEERELAELANGEESAEDFCKDSANLFVKYFIPHECNGHKPHFLRPKSLLSIALGLLFIKAGLVGFLFFTNPEGAQMSEELINRLLALTNDSRQINGSGTLVTNPVLQASAQAKADDMIANDYFAHYGPDGKKPWDWIDRAEYPYLLVGENLGMNFTSADSVHTALLNSPSHKKNLLNPKYTEVGLAMATGYIDGRKTNVLVEFFSYRKVEPTQTLAVAPAVEESVEVVAPAVTETPEPAQSIETEPEVVETAASVQELEEEKPEVQEVKNTPEEPEVIESEETSEIEPIAEEPSETEESASSSLIARTEERQIDPEIVDNSIIESTVTRNITEEPYAFSDTTINNPEVREAKVIAMTNTEAWTAPKILAQIVNAIFVTALAILVLSLLVNIFIRFHIQHKGVIFQSLALIVFVGSLIFFKFHFLESGLSDILIMSL